MGGGPVSEGPAEQLRRAMRHEAHQAGMDDIGEVASRVEDYALRHYVKVV